MSKFVVVTEGQSLVGMSATALAKVTREGANSEAVAKAYATAKKLTVTSLAEGKKHSLRVTLSDGSVVRVRPLHGDAASKAAKAAAATTAPAQSAKPTVTKTAKAATAPAAKPAPKSTVAKTRRETAKIADERAYTDAVVAERESRTVVTTAAAKLHEAIDSMTVADQVAIYTALLAKGLAK